MIKSIREQQYEKIVKFCVYRERHHLEVRTKLLKMEVYGDDLEEMIAQLIVDGFLNEYRYAKLYASGKFRINKWGKNKIRRNLMMKQIAISNIDEALEEIDSNEYRSVLHEIITKKQSTIKYKDTYTRNYKLYQFAFQKGYEKELIEEVLGDM